MFVLPRKPGFGEAFGSSFSSKLVSDAQDRSELAKRNAEIKKGFAQLGENPSRFELMQTIESLRIPDEQKQRLYQGFGDAEKDKLTREKTAQELAKSEKSAVRAKKLAQAYNISEEEAEGMEPGDIAALGRHRSKQEPGGESAKPIPPERVAQIEQVLEANKDASSDKLAVEMGKAGIPKSDSNQYVESRRREEDRKIKKEELEEGKIERSYKEHKPFIDSVSNSYKSWKTEMEPRLKQMQSLNEEELISPSAAKFLETLGIPLGMLSNPSVEYYSKLSQDLLKGLPESYGSRILKVEVDNFLRTIPTLLNSADGRRMIASNMLKIGEMKEIFYNEMRNQQRQYIDENKKFPKDFEQKVIDNVRPLMDRQQQDFIQMSQMKSIPQGHVPYFNPQGNVSFVPKNEEAMKWAETNGGRRIW